MSLRYAYFVALLSLPLFTVQATAQEYYVDDAVASDPSGSIYGANMSLGIPGGYFWARGDFGERPGVDGNYFSTGAFAPATIWGPNQISFLDAQIFVNDQMGPGGDIGLGHRFVRPGIAGHQYAIGLNGFLTWDESTQGSRNRRGSVGLEFMTDWVHANANYYIPISDTPDRIGALNRTKESQFSGNNLVFLNRQFAEQQMEGADVEIGVQVPYFRWMTLSGGGYFYETETGENVRGSTAKLGVDLTSAIFDITVQKDDMFGTTFNLGTEIRAGANGIAITPNYRNLDSKVYDRVRRRARIALQTVELVDQEIAINPATGMPFTVIHVDNTATAGGDGSNENRFNQLDLANGPNGDIILVHRGDTTRANLLAGGNGLNLDNNQIVLGEGSPFLFKAANRSFACPLPGFDQMGDNPFVTSNAGTNVINLANNNQVLGLNIIAPTGGNAIGGMNVSNFVINDINQDITALQDTGAGGGIFLRNATGTGRIINTTFKSSSLNSRGGIVIQNVNQTPLNLTIEDAPLLTGGAYGIDLVATNSVINANINNVQANMNGTGIRMDARNNGRVNTFISNSNFDNAQNGTPDTGDGVVILGTNNGLVNATLNNVNARGASRDAIRTTLDGSNAIVNVTDAILTGAMDDTYDAQLRNMSSLDLTLTNTTGGMAGDAGMELDAGMNSNITATLTNANFTPVGGDGINSVLTDGSTTSITATNSSFAMAGNDGLFVNSASGSTFNGSFTDGSFANAGGDGVDANFTASLGNTLVLNRTNANNAGGDGFKFNLAGGANFNAALTTVSLDNALANAINGNVQNGSSATINGTAVSGFDAGADAIRTRTNLNSTLNMTLANSGSFASAGGDGLDLGTTNNSTSNYNISGVGGAPVDFSGAGGFGLLSFVNNTSASTINFGSGANFNGAGSDAINLTTTNTSNTTLTGSNISGSGVGGDAIHTQTMANSTLNMMLTDVGSFASAGGDGLDLATSNNSTSNISIAGAGNVPVDFSGAGGFGLRSTAADTGIATLNFGSGANFNGVGADAINLSTNNSSNTSLTGTNFSGSGVVGDAINTRTNLNSTLNVNMTNTGSFAMAGGDGLDLGTTNNSTSNINIAGMGNTPVNFSGAGGFGLLSFANNTGTTALNFASGANFNSVGNDAINLTSNNVSNTSLTGPRFSGQGAMGDGIQLAADNGTITTDLTQIGDFSDVTGNAISYNAVNMGTLNMTFSGLPGGRADFTNAGARGVNGSLNNSSATLNLTDTNFNQAGTQGLLNNSVSSNFTANLTNSSFSAANGTALSFINSGNGAVNDINLNNVDGFSSATGHGLFVNTTANANTDIDVGAGGLNLTQSALDGINIVATTGSTVTFDGSNVSTALAGDEAAELFADNARIDFTLTGANSFNASGGDGLLFRGNNAATVNVNVAGTNFNDAFVFPSGYGIRGVLNNSTATLNVVNSTMDNAGSDGLSIEANMSTVTSALSNITMNNAGGNAFNIAANNMSTVNLSGNAISGNSAGNDGVRIMSDMSTVTTLLNNLSMNDAVGNAFNIDSNNMSNVTLTGDTLSGRNAGSDGIRIVSDASTTNIVMTNVGDFSNAGGRGVNANISNGSHPDFNLELSGVVGNRANFDGAGSDGLSVTLNNFVGYNAADPVFTFTNVNARNSGRNGFNLVSNGVSPGAPTTFNGLVTNAAFDFDTNAGPGNHAIGLILNGNDPFSRMLFNNVTGMNAPVDGVNVFAGNNTFIDIDILTPGGGGTGLSGAGDDLQQTTAAGGSTIDIIVN